MNIKPEILILSLTDAIFQLNDWFSEAVGEILTHSASFSFIDENQLLGAIVLAILISALLLVFYNVCPMQHL